MLLIQHVIVAFARHPSFLQYNPRNYFHYSDLNTSKLACNPTNLVNALDAELYSGDTSQWATSRTIFFHWTWVKGHTGYNEEWTIRCPSGPVVCRLMLIYICLKWIKITSVKHIRWNIAMRFNFKYNKHYFLVNSLSSLLVIVLIMFVRLVVILLVFSRCSIIDSLFQVQKTSVIWSTKK